MNYGVPDYRRQQILDNALVQLVSYNGHVEQRSATSAVVVYGKPVNHILHLLLSLFLCTLWVPVWLLMAAMGGQSRAMVWVDDNGQVGQQKMPMSGGKVAAIVLAVVWGLLIVLFFGSCASAMDTGTTR